MPKESTLCNWGIVSETFTPWIIKCFYLSIESKGAICFNTTITFSEILSFINKSCLNNKFIQLTINIFVLPRDSTNSHCIWWREPYRKPHHSPHDHTSTRKISSMFDYSAPHFFKSTGIQVKTPRSNNQRGGLKKIAQSKVWCTLALCYNKRCFLLARSSRIRGGSKLAQWVQSFEGRLWWQKPSQV